VSGTPWKQIDKSARWDAIVIGSGIGGLATAALLARHANKRVLVLERHYTPGGFTHVFRRPGYEWDVGVHYVGDVTSERAFTRRLLEHVGDGSLQWAAMDDVYDRVIVGGEAYDLVAPRQRFRDALAARFPTEAARIDAYLAAVRHAGHCSGAFFAEKAAPPFVAFFAGGLMRRRFLQHSRRTTESVLREIGTSPRLGAVLTGQWGDYGLPPSRSSFGMHAILVRHYLGGAAYPVGGAGSIGASLAPAITRGGGAIAISAEVASVVVKDGRARGVRMADGTEIETPLVVSDAGVHTTVRRLLAAEVASESGLARSADTIPASAGHLCAYVGLRRTAAELGLPKTNLWIYPGDDHDSSFAAFRADPDHASLPLVYVSFPSAKDPAFAARFPGRATIELITFAPWDAFAKWEDGRWRRRGPEYDALKERFAARMLDQLFVHYPRVKEAIDVVEVSTPLSTRHFANYGQGEIYGLDHTPGRFDARWLRPRTPIAGLWLTGQDVVTCGVAGALAGGYVTASAILGRNLLAAATQRA
jgi:all-trans-retinol 13,14-reductase